MFKLTLAILMLTGAMAASKGPVMDANENIIMKTATVHSIYVGEWQQSRIDKIQQFLQDLDGSEWFRTDKINYGLQSLKVGKYIVSDTKSKRLNQYDFGKIYKETKGWFTELVYDSKSTNGVLKIIDDAIQSKQLPFSPKSIYLVIPAEDVNVYSFPNASTWKSLCAFHDFYYSRTNTKTPISDPVIYSIVPALPNCSENKVAGMKSLHGDYGLDAVFFYAYHELVEAMTNPIGKGYFVNDKASQYFHQENADVCNYSFGRVCTHNGALYNTVIGNQKYLIQTNYDPKEKVCRNFGGIPAPIPGKNCSVISPPLQ